MQDRLIIARKVKKTMEYASKTIENYPHHEIVLKNHLLESFDTLLRLIYLSNVHSGEKKIEYRKDLLVELKMIDYYLKISCDKKLISLKKYHSLGTYLLDIHNMIIGWLKYEKEQSL